MLTLDFQTSEKPFLFSKLALTDDTDLACEEETIIKNLGTIQLKILRADVIGHATRPEKFKTRPEYLVHEGMKKATLSHQTGRAFPPAGHEDSS